MLKLVEIACVGECVHNSACLVVRIGAGEDLLQESYPQLSVPGELASVMRGGAECAGGGNKKTVIALGGFAFPGSVRGKRCLDGIGVEGQRTATFRLSASRVASIVVAMMCRTCSRVAGSPLIASASVPSWRMMPTPRRCR